MGNRGSSSHPIIPPEDLHHINEFGFNVDRKQLGEGLQGRVYRVQLTKPIEFFGDQRAFAIKMINFKERMDMCRNNAMIMHKLIEMIEREKTIMSDIDHRNVVRIHLCLSLGDFRTQIIGEKCVIVHDRVYMFMDLAEQSLHDFLHRRGKVRVSENVAKSLCRQLTEGLQYLHNKRIVHGDMHMGNVLMFTDKQTKQNIPKWADYGLSKSNVTDPDLFTREINHFRTYIFDDIIECTKFDSKESETRAKELSDRMGRRIRLDSFHSNDSETSSKQSSDTSEQTISLEQVLNHDWLN